MFTWICPRCGREVPPAYDECPDCAAKIAAEAVTGSAPPPGAVASPQQWQPVAPPPGPRGARRPLWDTGLQQLPPIPPPTFVPPPAFVPPPPAPPPPAAAYPPEAPPAFVPHQSTSPMFQPSPPQAPTYVVGAAPSPGTPKWLTWIAGAVLVVMVGLGLYWFFGRSQATSAVIETPAAAPGAATENPVQKYIEVSGIRFSPMSKGVQVAFDLINHSDSDVVGLTGTATIFAHSDKGSDAAIGTVKFQTSMGAQSSKEMQLPFDTKLKLMELPDWQNVSVKVEITGPPGA